MAPGPMTVASMVAVSFLGGGTVWYSDPANQQLIHKRLQQMEAQVKMFERRVGLMKFRRQPLGILEIKSLDDVPVFVQGKLDSAMEMYVEAEIYAIQTWHSFNMEDPMHLAAAAAAFFLAVMFMLLTFSCLGSRRSAPSSEALATEEEPEKKTAEGAADGDQASTSASEAGNDGSPPCTTWRAPPSEEQ